MVCMIQTPWHFPVFFPTLASLYCRDLGTGISLCSFKGSCSPAGAACVLGRDYIVSCQLKKPLLHFWDWRKEQVAQKSFIPEKCWSIACSRDGSLCAAGGESGSIHVWDTSVGRLLLSWKAHHKRITTIVFSDAGTEIVAGSEDSLVTVWSVSRVLHSLEQPHESSLVQPLHTWSDHTMPISAIVMGAGVTEPYVYVCSLDHRLSVRSLVSGRLLTVVTLPSALTALAVDPLEYTAYVGSSTGTSYRVSFVEEDSGKHRISEYRSSNGLVTSMALSRTGEKLVVGTEEGTVLVWDTVTGQQIRTTSIGSSVSTILVIPYPLGMAGRGRGRAPESSFRMKPLGNFSKVIGSVGIQSLQPWQTSLVLLDSHQSTEEVSSVSTKELDSLIGFKHEEVDVGLDQKGPVMGEAYQALQERVSQLERENALLTEQKNRAVSLLEKM